MTSVILPREKATSQIWSSAAGEERKGLDVRHLLEMFEKVRGEQIDDDALLLG